MKNGVAAYGVILLQDSHILPEVVVDYDKLRMHNKIPRATVKKKNTKRNT